MNDGSTRVLSGVWIELAAFPALLLQTFEVGARTPKIHFSFIALSSNTAK
jgi:hypothetical protein